MMTATGIRLALIEVAPLITIKIISRMVCTVGRFSASTGAKFPDAPRFHGRFSVRIAFPLPVIGLPIVDPDPLWVRAMIGGC